MDFKFRGVLCPVFTPFKDDKCRTINYDCIERYANLLKTKGVEGIVVNGWTGEGMTLTIDERKRLAEEWVKCGKKFGFKVFLVIGGSTTLAETYELAEHAERIRVDCCLVLTDEFYRKYMNEEDLVKYLKDIYLRMNSRPFCYVYRRERVKQRMDMMKFFDIIDKEIPTFTGIYYEHSINCDEIVLLKCYKPEKLHICGTKLPMVSPVIEGFDVICTSMCNLYPELLCKLYDNLKSKRYDDAHTVKDKLTRTFIDWTRDKTYDRVHPTIVLKNEFNKKYTDIHLGPVRMPCLTMRHMFY